jgi:hypothetical protein
MVEGFSIAMKTEPLQRQDVRTRNDDYQPVYRVDFWQRLDPPAGGDAELMGYRQDSYRLSGAKSVREVRSWAEGEAAGRDFVIWIELGPAEDRTIARVEGVDPTKPRQRDLAE